MRIPGLRSHDPATGSLYFSSKISKWLEEDRLLKTNRKTNWKRQYKLRHNWVKGSCNVSETRVADQPSIPPLLVRLHQDQVITADPTEGLRAWRISGQQRLIASQALDHDHGDSETLSAPTSLAIDGSNAEDLIGIAVGFANGSFGVYQLDRRKSEFAFCYMHAASANGTISAIAFCAPYLLTMTQARLLSLYIFKSNADIEPREAWLSSPRLLSSLKSHTAWPPLSLAIRVSPYSIFASIAYSMPTYLAGWSVGLQELLLSPEGTVLESRLASAQTQRFASLFNSHSRSSSSHSSTDSSPTGSQSTEIPHPSRPTSLSYTHPYLLAAHADNTLTLYMVTSTADTLLIGSGRRLWGHTSSVSGACVGDRGKAVSVSKHGNELRVWELEGGMSSNSARHHTVAGEASVQVRPEVLTSEREADGAVSWSTIKRSTNTTLDFGYGDEESAITKGWVAFNEESVVVLSEQREGAQNLIVYDFS